MLGFVRSLPDNSDAVISVLKGEGSLLDTRLLNQILTDNAALRELELQLDRDRERLNLSLSAELESLRRISSVHLGRLLQRHPSRVAAINGSPVSEITVVGASSGISEKSVDFWRGKHESSQSELTSVDAQLATVRRKIEDVKTVSEGSGGDIAAARMLCTIGALRQKLQSARSRTRDYQQLLSRVEGVDLPRSCHASNATPSLPIQGTTGDTSSEADFDREVLSLCNVESSVVNELTSAKNILGLVTQRKELLDSKISFFSNLMEVGDFSLASPPANVQWPDAVSSKLAISEQEFLEIVGYERSLESQRTTVVRERRVAMLREMGSSTMEKWISKYRLSRLCDHTERAVGLAEREKASLLFRIDEVSLHPKHSGSFV